ncbi:MAG: rfbC [Rhizobacter sp.]|nr:rfbC [Rhizobacter sp.]
MKLTTTSLPGVVVLEPTVFKDDRGWFMESFNEKRFQGVLAEAGLPAPDAFVQDNHSCSTKGVLRGLHFQRPPHAQGKLVRVVKGSAFDVAVDIRRSSPTFGQWTGVELTADNFKQLWIPAGFAHGFLTLEDDTHFLYKTTDYYAKDCEGAVLWSDPAIGIHWPLPFTPPSVAPKDAQAPLLADAHSTLFD